MDRQIGHYEEPDEDSAPSAPQPAPSTDSLIDGDRSQPTDNPSTIALRTGAARKDPLRAEALKMFQPKIPLATAREIREAVVGQIMLVPFESVRSDRTMCSVLYRFADYVYSRTATFDPDKHLTESMIGHYLKDRERELKISSQRTHRSTLLRIREGHPDKPRPQRIPRQAPALPYTQEEWNNLRRKVRELLDPDLKGQLTMLLDLTGEAGLRSQEAIRATGQWIVLVDGVTVIRIPDKNGEFRDVPIFGLVGDRLYRFRGSKDYLLAPHLNARANVMTKLRLRAEPHAGLADINPIRARNTWLVHLLTQRVPSNVIWAVAGVQPGAGGHTISDLMTHAPTPDSRTIVRDLNYARTR
ncbi:hypothetical protein EAH86_10490 [Pedococcus bigeumensis]|uniref:Uncharacterized protein n=2 Tax=Pedococcus bigeumensis TaxID=433644 RepID=A0A502CX10_9MICO|nr:hypothetical protein EAH86_10490 [Pedococcus bigeumensis]